MEEEKKQGGCGGDCDCACEQQASATAQAPGCAACEESMTGWKRALADYDNLKKDMARAAADTRAAVTESLAESILGVLMHFDLAVKHAPDLSDLPEVAAKRIGQWRDGILHIQKALKGAIAEYGVESFEPAAGAAFDPASMETVGARVQEGAAEGSVLEVVNAGWKIGEKIIRPARVIINEAT